MPSSAAPDQTPAVAYGLYTEEPIRTPGGGLIMPDLPPEARERKAKLARLSESSSWAEIVLLDWFKRIAVFGVSASFDIERFERATQSLWRLTAVAKSIFALEDNPNRPISPALESKVDDLLKSSATFNPLGARTSTSASPSPLSNSTPAQEDPSSPTHNPTPSADAPISQTTTPSPTAPTDPRTSFSALRTPRSALESSALESSALATPHFPTPSVRAVPACPTLSLDGIATYLSRTESDLAEAKRPTPPILDLPPTPAKSQPAQPPLESLESLPSHSPSPRSALATPPCASPCPSSSPRSALATPRCIECAEPFCASRQAVPFHHQPSVLKCDGTCRECSKTRACKFTPAYLRPG